MEWFKIKRILLIMYVLLITVGIYAIGVGANGYKKEENKLIILAKQYSQKQQVEDIKISSESTYQSFYEAKTALDKVNQAEASRVALIAENKAKQEEIERIAAESKEAAKKAADLVKDEADKRALEAEALEQQLLEEALLKENIE
jgi:hypothetical protein